MLEGDVEKRDDKSLMRCILTDAAAADLEKRYEHRRRLWYDGPYGGSLAFDKLMERKVGLYIAYRFSDIPTFIRQAKVRGRLRHPHLLPVLDFGVTADNLPFFTGPFVETLPLDSLLRTFKDCWPVSLWQLVQALVGVCRAVAYAHMQGACHHDLTPNRVHADCALEEVHIDGGWEEVAASPVVGTESPFGPGISPGYAAPEQFRFSPQELRQEGRWSLVDVYGLGGILYWLLYDSPPNQACAGTDRSFQDVVQRALSRQGTPPLGQLRPVLQAGAPEVVSSLQRIALKALHYEPRQRYFNVSEITADLDQWLVDHQSP